MRVTASLSVGGTVGVYLSTIRWAIDTLVIRGFQLPYQCIYNSPTRQTGTCVLSGANPEAFASLTSAAPAVLSLIHPPGEPLRATAERIQWWPGSDVSHLGFNPFQCLRSSPVQLGASLPFNALLVMVVIQTLRGTVDIRNENVLP